jgi:hypothetical protein
LKDGSVLMGNELPFTELLPIIKIGNFAFVTEFEKAPVELCILRIWEVFAVHLKSIEELN